MNVKKEPRYWVVASGDSNHDYSDIFLDFGIMAIGPGHLGNFKKNKKKYEKDLKKNRKRNHLSSITLISDDKRMQKDIDFVVLRAGTKKIIAIGKIKSHYKWSEVLEDVYGWRLQHYREVDWKKVDSKLGRNLLFGYSHNLCNLSKKKFKYISNKFGFDHISKKKCKLPKDMPEKFEPKKVNRYLKKELFNKFLKRVKFFNKYESKEQEITTFLVVPLLEGLGWEYKDITLNEHIGKKGGYPDVALRKKEKPFCVIETKYHGQGLAKDVKEQALSYVKRFRIKSKYKERFPFFLLTDGQHYYLYKSNKPDLPYAYINIDKKLYEYHPLFRKTKGAFGFLRKMKK